METTVSCCWSRRGATDYDELLTLSVSSSSKARIIWRLLLTKFKKAKKNMYCGRFSNTSTRFSYEAYEYAQNFDHGLMSNDFEDLSRSFSARFAVPSNAILHRKRLVAN